ncbi:hopanoid-associated sugar epimerase [Gloeomargarita lithophora Alchichica-D10]|uniref:Hopanoid-associated sugar epimerase n=1 Tax=Gloeomargarita lithophora Alchichica-D10 TaxID=1188229 RepID=A0A1J0AFE9_9CYAN|nr:hopanoid-associated sugar epimerase [Gloeomargarita lithophora]APB34627.1 hopanoid-associated sugar epimerase [Gloeomargarita lithophora Alchichica-D10]
MAQALVTGATGFVGANLVRLLLEQGHEVKVLVRPHSSLRNLTGLPVQRVTGNLLSPELPQYLAGCDVLFHVAAHYSLWQKDKDQLYQANVLGTRHILQAAKLAGVPRTVYTSSVAAIGVGTGGQAVDETHQSPVDKLIGDYKKSKYWGEQEALQAAQSGQDVVIVNPTTPIGAWDGKPTPTGEIILRFLRGQMPAYVNTGLNFIPVQDVAWGHLFAWQKGQSGQRYILGHRNLSLQEFLQKLAQITGLPAPGWQIPVQIPLAVAWVDEMLLGAWGKTPSLALDGVRMAQQTMYYDASRAIRELGLPQTDLDQAIREAVDWFRQQGMA